jgi:hypothetical protein
MTDTEQLAFLKRLIVTCDGPDRDACDNDRRWMMKVTSWMMSLKPDPSFHQNLAGISTEGQCQCGKTTVP